MQILLVLLSLVVLVLLCFKGVPIFFAACLSGILLLLTAGLDVVGNMTSTYINGLAGYFGANFFIFVFGSIFGKLTGVSGAADSIANTIVDKFGEKFIVPALIVAGSIMTYGGVSVFVAMFALYPLMLSLFRRADISRTLIPGIYFAGTTFFCWAPGSPQVQNLIPAQALGVSTSAAAVPGFMGVVFEAVLVFGYCIWLEKHSRKKGLHFEVSADDQAMIEANATRPKPSFLISILPMVVLLVVLNVLKWSVAVSLFAGVLAALICYWKTIDWAQIWKELSDGCMDGVGSLFNTAAVVGFGALVQITPAFQSIIEKVTNMNGNPMLISVAAIAVMAGVCGSGSGGMGIALPIINQYFVPMGVNVEALARVSALACLTLDSLPHNGLVVSVLNVTHTTHKEAYLPVFMTTVVAPILTLVFMLVVYFFMGLL